MAKKTIALFICAIFALQLSPLCRAEQLSPAFDVLAENAVMNKAGLIGYETCFSELDFMQALSDGTPKYITITSLPSADTGKLKLAGTEIYEGQVIPMGYVKLMTFKAATKLVKEASFGFSSEKSDTEIECRMTFLDSINYAPEIKQTVSEYDVARGSSLYASFASSDPESDACDYILVSAPKKGSVIIDGDSFCYTPFNDKRGSDSFSYVAVDTNGNYSVPSSLRINIKSSEIKPSDTNELRCDNAATILTSAEIMQTSGGKFLPELEITRIDFLNSVMKALNVGTLLGKYKLPFADCDMLDASDADMLASALYLGYVGGSYDSDGTLCFRPYEAISGYEAAAILSRALEINDTADVQTSAVSEEIPVWARAAFSSLESAGFKLSVTDEFLSRGDAAEMIYLASMINNGK